MLSRLGWKWGETLAAVTWTSSTAYKEKRHATPDTLPMDIKILDVTKNSASDAHVNIHLQVLEQKLSSCQALCTTTAPPPCILHVQGGTLYTASCAEVCRSFSRHSVKVVYHIVCSSARIDHSTRNAI